MKAAVVFENWKLSVFEREFKSEKIRYRKLNEEKGMIILEVRFQKSEFGKIRTLIEKCQRLAVKEKADEN